VDAEVSGGVRGAGFPGGTSPRTLQGAARSALRAHGLDLALAAAGLAFASVSLAFPFGRDQGLYYFVGREWLQHGAIPYRDTFEQKTPGIFLLNALAILLFGENLWGIRVIELGCIAVLGLTCARLAVPRGQPVPAGLRGLSVLAAAILYFGFLDFWNTAQCELACSTAALGAVCAVLRVPRPERGAFVGGLLAGAALVMKPPAAVLVLLAGACAVSRAWSDGRDVRRVARASVLFAAGVALPVAVVLAYFAAKGALPALRDVLVGANAYYVTHERGVHGLGDVAERSHETYKAGEPLSALMLELLVAAVAVAAVRRDRGLLARHLLAAVACAAAYLGVLAQQKFYIYHWGLLAGPATLVGANLALDAIELARARLPSRAPSFAVLLFAANFVAAYGLTGKKANMWLEEAQVTAEWTLGRIDRDAFTRAFVSTFPAYSAYDGEQVALWLRAHTDPADEVAVRGMEPEIYAIAHRRYRGRFFWTPFLTEPSRAYRRDAFLAQDREQLDAFAPRWVVAMADETSGPDSPAYFAPMGYVERERLCGMVILEKGDASPR
jgi:hypothetical protein